MIETALRYELDISGIPKGQNDRLSWQARAADTAKYRARTEEQAIPYALMRRREGLGPITWARVTFIICKPGRRLDPLNRPGHAKALMDGLVSAGLIKNDSDPYIESCPCLAASDIYEHVQIIVEDLGSPPKKRRGIGRKQP